MHPGDRNDRQHKQQHDGAADCWKQEYCILVPAACGLAAARHALNRRQQSFDATSGCCGLQEATSRMAADDYEGALGAAMDAVKQGQELYKRGPALQMFPLYLVAAQVGGRTRWCSW